MRPPLTPPPSVSEVPKTLSRCSAVILPTFVREKTQQERTLLRLNFGGRPDKPRATSASVA